MNENNPRPHPEDDPYFENHTQPEESHGSEDPEQDVREDRVRERRSIRNIPLGEERRRQNERRRRVVRDRRGNGSKHRRSPGVYILIVILLIIFSFFVFVGISLFAQATITVVPQSETVELDETVTVTPGGSDAETLGYDIITVDLTRSRALEATGEEEVSRPATGQITVFNTYSEEDQPIVSRTRFETEDGRVYRSAEAFVVPGMRANGEPGRVTVTVAASEPGESYNVSEARFTLPGLEGTELFDGFYAETATPLTGGFVGVQKTVDEDAEEEARESLRGEVETALREAVETELENDSVLATDTVFVEYEDLPIETTEAGVDVPVRGTLYGAAFNEDELARYIARTSINDYDGASVMLSDPDSLNFELEDDAELSLNRLEEEVTLTISGTQALVWQIRTEDLVENVAGDTKGQAAEQIGSFPGVASGNLELRPGFMRSLPSNTEKISVTVDDPAE